MGIFSRGFGLNGFARRYKFEAAPPRRNRDRERPKGETTKSSRCSVASPFAALLRGLEFATARSLTTRVAPIHRPTPARFVRCPRRVFASRVRKQNYQEGKSQSDPTTGISYRVRMLEPRGESAKLSISTDLTRLVKADLDNLIHSVEDLESSGDQMRAETIVYLIELLWIGHRNAPTTLRGRVLAQPREPRSATSFR